MRLSKWIILNGTALLITSSAVSQPQVVDSTLVIETVFSTGASPQPIMFEFLREDDPSEFLVAERTTGRIRHIRNGTIVSTVLDLAVNYTSERGLLGMAFDPDFADNGYVYVYYSATHSGNDSTSPTEWSGNRLERYRWNGSQLVDPVLIFEVPFDPTQANSVYHHGGVLRFGPDGKLYISVGDLDRGKLTNPRIEQNTGSDAVAGAGGIYRINPDGTIPSDNPFVTHPDPRIQKLWAYGIRNSFGMTFDPLTGNLWVTDNGPEVYDEINLVGRGMNGGWRKIMGPDARNAAGSWNGNRSWDVSDLIMLPNAYYADPIFSWLQPVGVTAPFFVRSARYEPNLRDQLLVGDANNGALYLFSVSDSRSDLVLAGNLADRVADTPDERNQSRWSWGWGCVADMKIGPDGFLYICSLYTPARGVFRIRPASPPEIVHGRARLNGWQDTMLGVPLTVELQQGGDTVQTIFTTLDAFGRFSERVNTPGVYSVRAKAGSYLSVRLPSISIAAQGYAYLPLVFTVNGDANGDNIIDDADLLTVLFEFGNATSNADLNGDGVVDDADLLIVLFNFGASGE